MDIAQVAVSLGVPVVSFITGVATSNITQRDQRSRLKSDIEILKGLPEDSQARLKLLKSIDDRVIRLSRRSTSSQTFWNDYMLPRYRNTPMGRATRSLLWLVPIAILGLAAVVLTNPNQHISGDDVRDIIRYAGYIILAVTGLYIIVASSAAGWFAWKEICSDISKLLRLSGGRSKGAQRQGGAEDTNEERP